jgi:hypothetical protein
MAKKHLISRDSKTGQFVVGREAFGKISSVEGIRMPRKMSGEFERLDRSKASPAKRREILASKYGKK